MVKLVLLTLILFCCNFVSAQSSQSSVVIWVQDFDYRLNNTDYAMTLNNPAAGSQGGNQWTINNVYAGNPTTTSQYLKVGNLGQISYANQNYLHISSDTLGNAHFDPSDPSDGSTTITKGICTYGYNEIVIAFWWIAGGSGGYGKVKYSIDGGTTWIALTNTNGKSQYKNQSVWKFSAIKDTTIIGYADLKIGFFWQNGSQSGADDISFAIDDITIVGNWDVNAPTVDLDASLSTGFSPNPVCHEYYGYSSFNFIPSDDLCPGSYLIQLSDSSGSFHNPTDFFEFYVGSATGGNVITVGGNAPFKSDFPIGNHYRYRINRTSYPEITGIPSNYFEIYDVCPDSVVVTTQPAIINDPDYSISNPANPPGMPADQQPACNCSVIDVEFFSYGAFNPGNTYSLELSDASGSFANPTVFGGPEASTRTWDPASPYMPPPPGTISGIIPCDTTLAPPGCNYYLRVVSSDTTDTFIAWGPFCIKQCDVTINQGNDLEICLTGSLGFDTLIPLNINTWDTSISYNPGNQFKVQLCDPGTIPPMPPNPDMTIVSEGDIGILTGTTSGSLFLSIPNITNWTALGLELKTYYLRIISTNCSDNTDVLGSLIRLTVDGISGDSLYVDINPDSIVCNQPHNIFFTAMPGPFPPTSKFIWTIDGLEQITPLSSVFVYIPEIYSLGWHTVTVRETGPGGNCIGPVSDIASFLISGPNINIVGDKDVCMGDTVTYSVEFFEGTYYEWSFAGNGILIDSSNNQITILWPTLPFPYANSVGVIAIMENSCFAENSATINVSRKTEASASTLDTIICAGDYALLIATNLTSPFLNTYEWRVKGDSTIIGTDDSIYVSPDTNSTYVATVIHDIGCVDEDEVAVNVHPEKPTITQNGDKLTSSSSVGNQWNKNGSLIPGASNQTYTVSKSGYYSVTVTDTTECTATSDSLYVIATYMDINDGETLLLFYPNPNEGILFIEYKATVKQTTISITNIHGLQVYQSDELINSNNKTLTLDINDFPAGVYFIKVQSQRGNSVEKFVKL